MNAIPRPPEDDLHAYVDGQLDPSRRESVEAWLAGHPDEARRVADWAQLNAGLRHVFAPVLDEAVPERLQAAARRPARGAGRGGWRMAAAIGWLALGTIIGYALHDLPALRPTTSAAPTLAHRAAVAHAVYVPEVRHPVEVGADQEAHLVQWLSKRLAAPLKVPRLAAEGYALVGGRLLPGEAGPVAQFMYEDGSGRRLTLYVRSDAGEAGETAFRYAQEGKVGVFYWLDGRLGYALSGEMPRQRLLQLAESVYKQLNP